MHLLLLVVIFFNRISMKLDTIIEKMRIIFVTREYFDTKITPIEKIVYGFISMTMITVVGAVLSFVIVRSK